MKTQKDIFEIAQILIKKHNKFAEDYALKRMQEFMNKDDVKEAGLWLSIASAVTDLIIAAKKEKLH